MHDAKRHLVTRRTMLASAGVGALGALVGCRSSDDDTPGSGGAAKQNPPSTGSRRVGASSNPSDSTSDQASQAQRTVMLGLVFTTRQQIEHLKQAIDADPDDAKTFTPLLSDREAQFTALKDEYQRVFGEQVPPTASETPANFPADPEKVVGMLRADATTAQNKFTDALAEASRYQAQLYGSIAACEATHRKVLGAVSS